MTRKTPGEIARGLVITFAPNGDYKQRLIDEITEAITQDRAESEGEIKRLEKREHISGCYWVYGDCTCKEIYDSAVKKDKNNVPNHLRLDLEKVLKIAKEKQALESENRALKEEVADKQKRIEELHAAQCKWIDKATEKIKTMLDEAEKRGFDRAKRMATSLILNDGYAITFQTMGQYRSGLVKNLENLKFEEGV